MTLSKFEIETLLMVKKASKRWSLPYGIRTKTMEKLQEKGLVKQMNFAEVCRIDKKNLFLFNSRRLKNVRYLAKRGNPLIVLRMQDF